MRTKEVSGNSSKARSSSRQGRGSSSISTGVIKTSEVAKASTSAGCIKAGEVLAGLVSSFTPTITQPIVFAAINAGFLAAGKCIQQYDGNKSIKDNDVQEKSESQPAQRKEKVDLRRPHVVDNFVGRKDVLRTLAKSLKKKGKSRSSINALLSKLSINDRKEFQRVCIVGTGGVGKTQLVAKYLKDCEKEEQYKSTYWINAEEKSYLDKSFAKLAKKLKIEENGLGESSLIDAVYAKINELSEKDGRSTIVVFDNADDSCLVQDYLPSLDYEFINLLITSRWRAWENMEIRVIPLTPFTPQESKEFITKEVRKNNINKEIDKLAEKLGYLPLALKQATAYINREKITIKEYLKRYEKKADELLGFDFLGYNDQHKKTVLTTWLVTFDKIEKKENGQSAMNILNVMAYLAPDNIDDSMLSKLDRSNGAIELLKNYSMIDQRKKEGLLDIHRLVQEVVRINLKTKGKEEEVLNDAIKVITNRGNTSQSYLDSFMCVCKHAMKYPALNDQLKNAFTILKKKLTKKVDEEYLRIAGEFLLAAVKSNNQELVKFALDNIKPCFKKKEKLEEWQEGYPVNNILLSCKNKEMMKFLKDLTLNVKLDYARNATYVIQHDNCTAAMEFLIENGMLDEKEQQEWLEQAILEVREDVVKLLLEKKPNLSLKNVTRYYNRGFSCFGLNEARGYASILEFAEQCCEEIEEGNKIICLIEDAQELAQGHIDDSPSTRETSISSGFEKQNDQSMEEDNESSDFEQFTYDELENARSTPSSAMEVVDVQQPRTRSGKVYSKSY